MASEELKTVNELLEGVDLGGLTLQERRAFFAAAAAPPPAGTTIGAVDADGVPAEWVTAAGVTGQRYRTGRHGSRGQALVRSSPVCPTARLDAQARSSSWSEGA